MRNKVTTVLCDSNIIVQYLLGQASQQGEGTIPLLDHVQLGQTKAIILEAVFIEVVFILDKFYHIPRPEVAQALQSLLQYRCIINDTKSSWIQALRIYSQTTVSIVDCLLLAQAQHHNLELITCDQVLNKMSRQKRDK